MRQDLAEMRVGMFHTSCFNRQEQEKRVNYSAYVKDTLCRMGCSIKIRKIDCKAPGRRAPDTTLPVLLNEAISRVDQFKCLGHCLTDDVNVEGT